MLKSKLQSPIGKCTFPLKYLVFSYSCQRKVLLKLVFLKEKSLRGSMFQYFNRKMIFLETCFSFMFPGVFIYAKYKHAEHLIKCDMFYKKTHVKIICSCKSYDLGTGEVDFQATGTHFVSLSSDFNLTTCMNIKTFQRGRGVPPGPMVRQKTKSTKNELFKWEVRTYIFFAFAVEPIAEMYVFDVLIPFTCQMHVYHLLRYQHDHCSCAFSMASGLWHAE